LRPKASKVRPNNRWFARCQSASEERQDEGGTCRVEAKREGRELANEGGG
jgi:hypothetical protein